MSDDAWSKLHAFTEKEGGPGPGKTVISRSDSLFDDLHLEGDDANEFMEKFFATFPVERGDYDFYRYFSEEGFNVFEVLPLLFSKKARAKAKKEPLILSTLEHAIQSGKFDSSVK